MSLENVVTASSRVRKHMGSRFGFIMSTTALSTVIAVAAGSSAFAQTAQPATQAAEVEEVVVTGSRIVREGYEAPTPLTVVGPEQMEQRADSNLANLLATMPALTGSQLVTNSANQLTTGLSGVQTLNLRSLGGSRTLVLLDGQRTVGATNGGLVDIGTFPAQLIQRVDIVTGGASAVYGSDAVAGVVNFILDKKFTGVKGEISGGITNYGDNKNYKLGLSAGFGFGPDDRGHVLISGEHNYGEGVRSTTGNGDGGRDWNRTGWLQYTNPAYTPTNGQPQLLFLPGSSLAAATPGSIIVDGPLKGTAFGVGGTPYKFNYGTQFGSNNTFMQGGDWKNNDMRPWADLEPSQSNQNLFLRVAYDVTDNISAFVQWNYGYNWTHNLLSPIWMPGVAVTSPSAYLIKIDNAFLPTSVRNAMTANGLTQVSIGTWNVDMPGHGSYNSRITNRLNAGLNGSFDAFQTAWKWDAYYSDGSSKIALRGFERGGGPITTRYKQAIDAVVNPANGQIVCRVTLTDPTSGCRPWNPLGIGMNGDPISASDNKQAYDWISGGGAFLYGMIREQTYAASVTGEPLALWAGPVSLALSFEHRHDSVYTRVDQYSATLQRVAGNYGALAGEQSVTEGAVETVIPLAKGESWAKDWELTAAARFTGYQYAGFVTTYKFGTTYAPIDDVKFRLTRSRDIRAPNIQELFAQAQSGTSGSSLIDRGLPGSPATQSTTRYIQFGNINLQPEKADTTGIGAVFTPGFLPGFTASVDYWDVDIGGAIQALNPQQVIDSCYSGQNTSLCPNIHRDTNGLIDLVTIYSINLAQQDVRGIDLEASYRLPMSEIVSDWRGNFSLHGLMTFYLRNYANNTFNLPTDRVGENGGDNPPDWKLDVTATYQLDPVTVSLTGRAFSSGTINATYVTCTTACPAATVDHPTTNYNYMPGRFYLDANVGYKLDMGDATSADLFFSVRNMFNASVPPSVTSYYSALSQQASLYDRLGAVYRAGIRFKM